ncbi:hypothetical protein [Acidiferrobacter sp. SPIII_3]|uniref:hypothetical protein n=1 Tax=Acidiferrobacter sp. SPIII_3 TaxID=1281578 RepID=UPI00143CC534
MVSIADTVADKIVGYLRRTAQDQAGLGRGAYDDRLVRHLYDVYAIRKRAADQCPLERLIPLVTQVIARDQAAYGNQFPAFRAEPTSVLLGILESLTSDAATGKRYMRFCQSLIWGETPSYSGGGRGHIRDLGTRGLGHWIPQGRMRRVRRADGMSVQAPLCIGLYKILIHRPHGSSRKVLSFRITAMIAQDVKRTPIGHLRIWHTRCFFASDTQDLGR